MSQNQPNLLMLAAEHPDRVIHALRQHPQSASIQDEHGYSLLHAAASYDHLVLAKALKEEFNIAPNLCDEDGETALFVVETIAAARCLVEHVGVDPAATNYEGQTAASVLKAQGGDLDRVADYIASLIPSDAKSANPLRSNSALESRGQSEDGKAGKNDLSMLPTDSASESAQSEEPVPPLPPGIQLRIGTLEDEQNIPPIADPSLRQRIDELAARDDFQGEEGQRQLRTLIADAVHTAAVGDDSRDSQRRRV